MTARIITSEATNKPYLFADDQWFEKAQDWYNAGTKQDKIEWCRAHGVAISRFGKLVSDWAEIAMEAWAKEGYARSLPGYRDR